MPSSIGETEFDKTTLVYTAGESITGSVTFEGGSKGIKLYDVQVVLARVVDKPFEPKPPTGLVQTVINTYFGDVVQGPVPIASYYFAAGENAIYVPQASYKKCPFSIQVPEGLWSTFHAKWGNIDYKLFITQRSQSLMNAAEWFQLEKEIVIIGLVTAIPNAFSKQIVDKQVYVDRSGKEGASMTVRLDKTSVIPGEKFFFKVEICNGTKLPLANVKMHIQQNIVYDFVHVTTNPYLASSRRQDYTEMRIVVQKEGPIIPPGPGRKVNWVDSVQIPHVVPTGLGSEYCPCIKIYYEMKFFLLKFVNLRVKLPLHIGTAIKSTDDDDDGISLAYGLEMTRSEFSSIDLDSISLSSGCSSWVSSTLDLWDIPPRYSAVETPPPDYTTIAK